MMTNDGYLNTSPIICRISLLEPKYLNNTYQPNIKLNKDQKEIFIKYISENWNKAIQQLEYTCWGQNVEIDMNKYYNLQCPDYSLLEVNNYG